MLIQDYGSTPGRDPSSECRKSSQAKDWTEFAELRDLIMDLIPSTVDEDLRCQLWIIDKRHELVTGELE